MPTSSRAPLSQPGEGMHNPAGPQGTGSQGLLKEAFRRGRWEATCWICIHIPQCKSPGWIRGWLQVTGLGGVPPFCTLGCWKYFMWRIKDTST